MKIPSSLPSGPTTSTHACHAPTIFLTAPATGELAASSSWKVDAFTVAGSTASPNVTVTDAFVATPAAPAAGDVALTLGPLVSAA